jgi:magnesium transporter
MPRMSADPENAILALTRRFLLDHPLRAAQEIERITAKEATGQLGALPPLVLAPVFEHLASDVAAELLQNLPESQTLGVLAELAPTSAARLLSALPKAQRAQLLSVTNPAVAAEVTRLMTYPEDSAGRLMETEIAFFRGSLTIGATLDRLRLKRARTARSLFIVDEDNRLSGRVSIQDLALGRPDSTLNELAQPVSAAANAVMPRSEVVDLLERHKLADLPVIDVEGRLLGIIHHASLIRAIQEETTADLQTMVGASRHEKALSPPMFAVRQRLPWLQVNLLTAFLAAGVVGLFEDTIARFTALAVLLPIVAGQSGNAGAQALAVTMRGLALREISLQHSMRITLKEIQAGFINGIAIAATCGLGVYIWSRSVGLVIVIALSMVLAMVAAGFAGAVVPILLTRLGQDPAQSSSIVLTTVTDVAGFLSFLGIATLLANML